MQFLDALTPEEAKALLDAFLLVPKIEFQVERILSQIAPKHLALVWDFFGQRLNNRAVYERQDNYEAFPYEFHGLEKELSKDAALAVSDLVTNGRSADADFVLGVMENYRGERKTHEVLKRIVAKYPKDEKRLTGVTISFDNTGVVSGEFGMVDAIRRKKAAMEPWLADPRPEVQAFAETYIRQADIHIADEQRYDDGRPPKDRDEKGGEGGQLGAGALSVSRWGQLRPVRV